MQIFNLFNLYKYFIRMGCHHVQCNCISCHHLKIYNLGNSYSYFGRFVIIIYYISTHKQARADILDQVSLLVPSEEYVYYRQQRYLLTVAIIIPGHASVCQLLELILQSISHVNKPVLDWQGRTKFSIRYEHFQYSKSNPITDN